MYESVFIFIAQSIFDLSVSVRRAMHAAHMLYYLLLISKIGITDYYLQSLKSYILSNIIINSIFFLH